MVKEKIIKLYRTGRELKGTAVHHYGDSNASISILKFLYYSFFRVNTFILYEISLKEELQGHGMGSEFNILKPTTTELDGYRKGLNLPREFYYDEIHGVKNVYLVFCGDEIAYIHWVYLSGDPNRFLRLSSYTAELNYNTTLSKFRGKGLMNKMMRYINLDLKDRGFSKACGVVNADNLPAVKSMERAGFKIHSRIKAVGPFNSKRHL